MPKRIPLHRVLDDMRGLAWALLKERRFTSRASDVFLLVAVAIGHLEARPLTPHKLAMFIGIPRATAARRLQRLEAAGLVQRGERGRYLLTQKAMRRVDSVIRAS
ncbi:MarR family transcriptional regulator [Ralstonia pseudosolanacearum]|uniref:MarR family transcriptional regulator n=1 Tax=Ralstonia pseudosolanacearum TaxID=1310165 RepID=UPI003AADED6A